MLKFEPQAYMHRTSPTLLLMVNQGNDVIVKTSSQLKTFGKAHESMQVLFLEGAGHFEQNIGVQTEFLRRYILYVCSRMT